MKAIMANFSLKREAWGRVKARLFRRGNHLQGIIVELVEIPEPSLVSPQWVKVRSIMSGISCMDEGLILNRDPSAFGSFLSFPFVPGNENVGIVTETGNGVGDMELGGRVVVDPLLCCQPREVEPPCESCARGEPSSCRSFAKGIVGPGMVIGGCHDTGGGWGDSFVAHRSQVHRLPDDMETDLAILVPEFARVLQAVLQNPPGPGDRVLVMGAGSLGLLTVLAMDMLGHHARVAVVAEHFFEAHLVKRLTDSEVVVSPGPGAAYDEVADLVGGSVRYPQAGRITMEGGADLVYETSGNKDLIEDALHFTGEGKRLVLVGLRDFSGFDLTPLWFKGVRIQGTGFSGKAFYDGKMMDTFDIAMDLARQHGLPVHELVTHRFLQSEYADAFSTLENRSQSRAVKVIFQHVV